MGFAGRVKQPLSKIAIIDPVAINEIEPAIVTKQKIETVLTGEISSHTHIGGGNLTLGILATNAYYGDKGKTAYDHSQTTHAPSNAEVNINADWNAGSGDAQILNKPSIPVALADLTDDVTHRIVTDTEKSTWNGKEAGGAVVSHESAFAHANIATAYSHSQAAHAPGNAQKNSDITKPEIEAKLTGPISSHSHAGGGGMNLLKKTANQTINAGAGVFTDITDLTFPVVSGVDYAFCFYITFQSSVTTTGWKAGVNCPAGTLDFWARSDVIANGAAGVATHTERHNTVRDDMTLLTATVSQSVDLAIEIRGRYLCTANGTFAARFANELSANTNIVVQKGSWGYWF